MHKIFVSGCYDILHAGHVAFFEDARKLGDHLTVSVATDSVLHLSKGRSPSLPISNKISLIRSLRFVDEVVPSSNNEVPLDFRDSILASKANLLVVTEDDKYAKIKQLFCIDHNIEFIMIPKRTLVNSVSTTEVIAKICHRLSVPLRVDFAGGWLDVPKLSYPGGFIVNCTITPLVSLENWGYRLGSGLGGSAAKAILECRNGVQEELATGAGWQDSAVIEETGLCVWCSGSKPVLDTKVNPEWLTGRMLLYWTGNSHRCSDLVEICRDYSRIADASKTAREAVRNSDLDLLGRSMNLTYSLQLQEGMDLLPEIGAIAMKYSGSGHGGYALCLFDSPKTRNAAHRNISGETLVIEPYLRDYEW